MVEEPFKVYRIFDTTTQSYLGIDSQVRKNQKVWADQGKAKRAAMQNIKNSNEYYQATKEYAYGSLRPKDMTWQEADEKLKEIIKNNGWDSFKNQTRYECHEFTTTFIGKK